MDKNPELYGLANSEPAGCSRRNQLNEAADNVDSPPIKPRFVKTSVYTEFTEFTRKEIKEFENKFKM
jgi:hypothetical protein